MTRNKRHPGLDPGSNGQWRMDPGSGAGMTDFGGPLAGMTELIYIAQAVDFDKPAFVVLILNKCFS